MTLSQTCFFKYLFTFEVEIGLEYLLCFNIDSRKCGIEGGHTCVCRCSVVGIYTQLHMTLAET